MAHINEGTLVIKVSELVRGDDNGDREEIFNQATIDALEEVISELVGSEKMVEVIKD